MSTQNEDESDREAESIQSTVQLRDKPELNPKEDGSWRRHLSLDIDPLILMSSTTASRYRSSVCSVSLFPLRTSCYRLLQTAIPACPLGAAAAATTSPATASRWPTGAIRSSLSMTKWWTPQRVTVTTSTNKATIRPSLLSCYGQEPVDHLPARLDQEMALSPITCLTYASNNPRAHEPHCGDWIQPHVLHVLLFQRKWSVLYALCFLIFTRRQHVVHTFMFIRTYQCMDNLSKKRIYIKQETVVEKIFWFNIH